MRTNLNIETKEPYNIGCDMGTSSIGIAAVKENGEVVVVDDERIIESYLFKDYTSANKKSGKSNTQEKRSYRSSRRRYSHYHWRLNCFNSLFEEELTKVDKEFCMRLKESFFIEEDKKVKGKYNLFNDSDYTDSDYFREFPTNYHLLKHLRETTETPDIRLVYLGLAYLLKNRGHFNFKGDASNLGDTTELVKEFCSLLQNYNISIDKKVVNNTIEILKMPISIQGKTKVQGKNAEYKKLDSRSQSILKMLLNKSEEARKVFDDNDYKEKVNIKLSDLDDEDKYAEYIELYGSRFELIEKAYEIYNCVKFNELLDDEKYISESKIKAYNKYAVDLKDLRYYISKLYPEKEEEFAKELKGYLKCTGVQREKFMKYLNKEYFSTDNTSEIRDRFIKEYEADTFLPAITSKENSRIPIQLMELEAKEILNNLEDKIPFLKENREKILSCITFRIPYYVGPLKGKRSWAILKKNEYVTPWNFNEVVDTKASLQKWMNELIGKCTYLPECKVIPKNSVLYSCYTVLNEINNIKVNNLPITVEEKQGVFELFKKHNKVSKAAIKKYLVSTGYPKDIIVSGIKKDCTSTLSPLNRLNDFDLSLQEKEDLIYDMTVIGQDAKLYKETIRKKYPQLTEDQLKVNVSDGWGRLSKEFLTGIYTPDLETGEAKSIMDILWETNDNLMQILTNKYMFKDSLVPKNFVIDELPIADVSKSCLKKMRNLIKRMVHKIGYPPTNVYIETTRCPEIENKGKETKSRKQKLLDIYEKDKEWVEKINSCSDKELRSDRIYLHLMQRGISMYTGEKISLKDNLIDKDHIYPFSKSGDDSIDNLVLVEQTKNQIKDNVYPIDSAIQSKMKETWKKMLEMGAISEEKYARLIRTTGFTDDELSGFVNRQLNATTAINLYTRDLVKHIYPECNVYFTRSSHISDLRQQMNHLKIRDLNDLHHAQDAYLAVIAGNVFRRRVKNIRNYSFTDMFSKKRNQKGVWDDDIREVIDAEMRDSNIIVYREPKCANNSKLFDATIQTKGKGLYPLKTNDKRFVKTEVYGGYKKLEIAFYLKIKYLDKKNNWEETYVAIPYVYQNRIDEYLKSQYDKYEVLGKLLLNSIVTCDGVKYIATGKTGKNFTTNGKAEQLIIDVELIPSLKNALSIADKVAKDIKVEELIRLYDVFEDLFVKGRLKNRKANVVKMHQGDYRANFLNLDIFGMSTIIKGLLSIANGGSGDLTLIGGAKGAGKANVPCNFIGL